MSLIPKVLQNRVLKEESNEILVDLNTKVESPENSENPPPETVSVTNFNDSSALADFHNLSLDGGQPQSYSSISDGQTVIQPLRVALPECNLASSCSSAVDSNLTLQNNVNHSVLNIKDLEYPTEILSEESPVNEERFDVVDCGLIDPLTSEDGLMEVMPPPLLNLPPPLQPIVVQSGKTEARDQLP